MQIPQLKSTVSFAGEQSLQKKTEQKLLRKTSTKDRIKDDERRRGLDHCPRRRRSRSIRRKLR